MIDIKELRRLAEEKKRLRIDGMNLFPATVLALLDELETLKHELSLHRSEDMLAWKMLNGRRADERDRLIEVLKVARRFAIGKEFNDAVEACSDITDG